MKTVMKIQYFALAAMFVGCVSQSDLDPVVDPTEESGNLVEDGPMQGMNVSDAFSYATTKQVKVNLTVPTFLSNAVVHLYSKTGTQDSLALGKATFNSSGKYNGEITLSTATDSLLIFSEYLGLTKEVRLGINGTTVSFDYSNLYESGASNKLAYKKGVTANRTPYNYLSSYDSEGVPTDMAAQDAIDGTLLDDINNSLPESAGGIPNTHPEFLAGKETEIVLEKEADVWVTFVAEGAGYRNSLGFYTYTLGNEPKNTNNITHHIVFANASMKYSGGGLVPGDRMLLGRFPANTVISWFLVANGWGGSNVKSWEQVYYANPNFNPESSAEKRNHMVLLHDKARNLKILGFEDLNRDGNSDEDFNDAVFYVSSNPVDAIKTSNVALLDAANDSDGDGINDALDEFPFDVNKAFNNYYPSEQNSGTLVYEDLWPSKGDYDFNDLVVNYNFNLISNAQNLITSIEASYTVNHIGGSFHNGFAFVLPIAPSSVTSTSGQLLNGKYESVNSNGTETGTAANETVILVCGDAINQTGNTITVTVDLNTPVSASTLGAVPFNTFLIVNGDRTREVHLPDLDPTSKAKKLGTMDDYSDVSLNRFYKTNKNLPWALNMYYEFEAPAERTPITSAYPKFKTWANSGGTLEPEWYKK
ncbi:LruC domain-containing protein [Zhouia sp. PK063]|uniref:LruC domain-containing protein n=1 Tax=Zhouia sp. PK063 TaxID=3373602 RepID=UPI0037BAA1DE